ncbi:RNA methyltransferase, RsmD family [Actinomyces sp. ICM58]|jgi:RNA methyltransferase, rsmD family|uniref:16S rRNA (guanine(966)-N(2))-methyltransferase RsmD n=1 Tax=unclassified Actinomyces TaxID=2609248 RepID=UPI00027711E6|nr:MULTISPECIES: 16S rRNA (guanine(966)-N(2))-methyltransferase RsmD [unclassified Actinomyces]EJN51553.1 RNA methyltransferase, RsmD family [Actinomyces sp. ICM58]
MTRIVAGSAKGRTLAVPKSGTRPTSERVREALFSRLDHMNVLEGATVLDLFAGTGALGLEALSRGAARATLVEKASAAARVATANVRATGLSARVVTADVRAYLGARSGEALTGEVDLVFIDPPYDIAEEDMATVLSALAPWVGPDSLIVVERSTRAPAPTLPPFLVLEDTRAWGETVAYFAGPPLPKNEENGDDSDAVERAAASPVREEIAQ